MINYNGRYGTSFTGLFTLCVALLALIAASATASAGPDNRRASGGGKVLTLNLKGTGIAYDAEVPAIAGSGTTAATCFDVELFDLSNGLQIGTATDCLSDIVDNGGSIQLVATSFFNFTGGSQLVSRGLTTVQPILHGASNFTHITGAEPSGGNDVISGSRRFRSAQGSVRLSGLVNLAELNTLGQISFDCIFVVNLD
ncbi:hypothetical protein [Sulfuriflexus mobilis]|uniref:hypothetical protein n=1 Tax=Sulfuriflexus mobilis TaxID=1811807 RepID=UPI000F8163C3|nr:hypothetical protein [Sulfuriflexus mobilis]